jgi:hypothetical protein
MHDLIAAEVTADLLDRIDANYRGAMDCRIRRVSSSISS